MIKRLILSLVLLAGVVYAEEERQAVTSPEPDYPEIAKRLSLHGTVKLKLWIAPAGNVTRVEYIGGHPLLAESAISAVKKWTYEKGSKETTQMVFVKF